ncbi:hypothetical protein KIPB_017089, partial [Kipferlia bialata]
CLLIQYIFNQLSEDPTYTEYCHMVWAILIVNAVMVLILSGMNPIAALLSSYSLSLYTLISGMNPIAASL